MFIFYKMEYVIAYKILLKESIDENIKTFFGNVTCPQLEHAVLLIFMSICLESMTQHHFVWHVFVTPMLNIPALFNAVMANACSFCLYWTCTDIITHTRDTLDPLELTKSFQLFKCRNYRRFCVHMEDKIHVKLPYNIFMFITRLWFDTEN